MEAREFASRRKPAACFVSSTKTTIPGNSDTNCKADDNFKTFWNLLSSADWLLFRNRSCDFLYFLLWYNFVYNTVKPAGRFGGPSSQLTLCPMAVMLHRSRLTSFRCKFIEMQIGLLLLRGVLYYICDAISVNVSLFCSKLSASTDTNDNILWCICALGGSWVGSFKFLCKLTSEAKTLGPSGQKSNGRELTSHSKQLSIYTHTSHT